MQHDRGLGVRFVVGADEAGRGCLAGPLVTGGVLLDLERVGPREVRALGALDDSKRVPAPVREELLETIRRIAVRVAVVVRTPEQIDRDGLHVCNLQALADAASGVACPDALCLIDGFAVPGFGHEQRRLVGGDGRSAAVAAASIVAKVTRDRVMRAAAVDHPHWGFDIHKGYGTAAHRAAIARHGLSPLHRRSFRSAAYPGADGPDRGDPGEHDVTDSVRASEHDLRDSRGGGEHRIDDAASAA
ncbi:MAG: ribonuclease HII [Solirubrobacteraceae bacterium]